MYKQLSQLLMYGDLDQDGILYQLGEIFHRYDKGDYDRMELVRDINTQIKHLLKVATDYGFDDNLWHNYLTFFLMMSENPFSMTCEKVGASEGTVNLLVENDFRIFKSLFDYDFSKIEKDLGIDCFSRISNYHAISKKDLMYNKNVSEKVRALSKKLENTTTEQEFFDVVTGFYKDYGVGMFGLNKAFRIEENPAGGVIFRPINNMDQVMLDDLVGYEIQKKKLVDNTEAFVQGRKANNCLLFGDSGTGKSTSIKAIVNQYYDQGLRMIEIYKHQFKDLSRVIADIKNRNYRFIIYMDDLSFEEFEIEYKFLKAVIEGGVETKPENILIYATSNRRHLIKESWNDRNDMEHENDRHHSDTVEEKLSLVNRFGVTINYSKPTQKEYFDIVLNLARKQGITMSDDELRAEANKWELSHGGISGRTAQQFVNYLASQEM
ncbi:ATP-binding protein [Roseburia sp. MUC/MUC-530-WT-4D]|uniref:ATP-binding protein n=1 Tax=Roseburia porci TaxID=2605790 RepID=A0A6L5YSY9_9FIRM|nr:ATP-binding protein [Roseburia porci]MCI5516690.1 ATP-binding protein [Roseburia sp.]MDD6742639.1 ATP-binding protein [Roseburia porci]MST75554.1 ATP-binding protein [Roseburia porci]